MKPPHIPTVRNKARLPSICDVRLSQPRSSPMRKLPATGLYRQFREAFSEVSMCVYEGPWLFRFMHHLASNQRVPLLPYIDIATRTKSDAMAKIAASWEE